MTNQVKTTVRIKALSSENILSDRPLTLDDLDLAYSLIYPELPSPGVLAAILPAVPTMVEYQLLMAATLEEITEEDGEACVYITFEGDSEDISRFFESANNYVLCELVDEVLH